MSHFLCMHRLHELTISGCPVSFAGLKPLISVRRRKAKAAGVPFEEEDFEASDYPKQPITLLSLKQGDRLASSEEKRRWLDRHVQTFDYQSS